MDRSELERRAAHHAALADPTRLAIVDELAFSDRSPSELASRLGVAAPLLAFHLQTLEAAGIVRRSTSAGDRRRRYLRLITALPIDAALSIEAAPRSPTHPTVADAPVVFVCTHNSARSQIAAALWRRELGHPASSGGTHPVDEVHPGAIRAAARAGLDLSDARPRYHRPQEEQVVITVCDRAHEDLRRSTWHWSVPDPAAAGTDESFDAALADIWSRIRTVGRLIGHARPDHHSVGHPAAKNHQEEP